MQRGNIRAVIFDLDGLLLNTEEIFTQIIQEKVASYGKSFTWDIKAHMMGRSEPEARRVLLTSLWPDPTAPDGLDPACPFPLVETEAEREDPAMIKAVMATKPMPGAVRLVQHLAKHNVPIAIASGSSGAALMLKRANNAELFDPFGEHIVTGDDPRITRNKPHPDIFLLAAHSLLGNKSLEVHSNIRLWGEDHDAGGLLGGEGEVLVFEDAVSGVQAGVAAGMKVVWVSNPELRALSTAGAQLGASLELQSLEEFIPEEWGLPAYQKQ